MSYTSDADISKRIMETAGKRPSREKPAMYEQSGQQGNCPGNDPVNHPSHYTDGGIETIDFIEAKKLGYHLASALKYISRAGKKDPAKTIEDLRKAEWYLKRYIGLLEKEEEKAASGAGYTPASPTGDLSSALIRAEKGGA